MKVCGGVTLTLLISSTYRLTLSKAHPNITLESDVITAWELERVEACHKALRVLIVVPLAEYRGIRSTTVFVGDQVLVLHHVLHGLGDTASRKAAVDGSRLHFDL